MPGLTTRLRANPEEPRTRPREKRCLLERLGSLWRGWQALKSEGCLRKHFSVEPLNRTQKLLEIVFQQLITVDC